MSAVRRCFYRRAPNDRRSRNSRKISMDAYIRAVGFTSRVAGVIAAFLIGVGALAIADEVIE